MRFVMLRDDYDCKLKILLEIEDWERTSVSLDWVEKAMIRECEKSDKTSDKLLALETIVRRIEEQSNDSA